MTIYVHVNRHLIARNRSDGGRRPVYAVKRGGLITYAHGVTFTGPATLIDPRTHPPLPCGARVYLTTEHEVLLVDPCPYAQAKETAA